MAPFAGRMQPVLLPNGAIVVRDEETGSPDTFEAMLKVMRESEATRRVLVIGDELSQMAIFVDDHGHHAGRAAVQAGMNPENCHVVPTLQSAADLLKRELRRGDLVFLKGKTMEHLSRILFAQFGNIGCWTNTCRIRRLCDLCDKLKPEFDLVKVMADPAPPRGAALT
jgi:UDP-N-acetylmuramoyl-tripeptide--D-alanyl-D-alanine ligase